MKLSQSLVARIGALTLAAALAGCSGSIGGEESADDAATLKIGFVSTTTGALAPFGQANSYVVDEMKAWFADNPSRSTAPTTTSRSSSRTRRATPPVPRRWPPSSSTATTSTC